MYGGENRRRKGKGDIPSLTRSPNTFSLKRLKDPDDMLDSDQNKSILFDYVPSTTLSMLQVQFAN